MKYLNQTFSVGGYDKEYAENYERVFGKRKCWFKDCKKDALEGKTRCEEHLDK